MNSAKSIKSEYFVFVESPQASTKTTNDSLQRPFILDKTINLVMLQL